jgi:hypothetical protein
MEAGVYPKLACDAAAVINGNKKEAKLKTIQSQPNKSQRI